MTSNFLDQNLSDSEEDDDFNPGQEVGSDNEADTRAASKSRSNDAAQSRRKDDDDDDEEDDGTSKPKARFGLDDDDEDDEDAEGKGEDLNGDDDDEDDEEEDDEEDDEDRPRKRRRRHQRNQFIDVEAEVDDEDEEDEMEDDEIPDEMHPDDALDLPAGTEHDDRRHRELDRIREAKQAEDLEKQAADYKERYGRNKYTSQTDVSTMPQHLLLPSVNDPPIYAVRAKQGKEMEVVNTIMKRFADRIHSRDPLKIMSVFSRPDTAMNGYIYIEARTQQDVLTATEDVPNCYSRNSITLLPIVERPDLLRTTAPKVVEPGSWVRIKRPALYAGDLAQVQQVEDNAATVELKILPRLDYIIEDEPGKRKRNLAMGRPPARHFNEQKAKAIGAGRFLSSESHLTGKTFRFRNDIYEQGFLIKEFKLRDITTDNVNPTLEEVAKFATGDEEGRENLDLQTIAASLKAVTGDYLAGDKVEIYKGEQAGVKGKVAAVRADIVTVEVTDGSMRGQKVEAPIKELRKLFREGDHVKVLGGSKYADEVGMVVRIVDDSVQLITDATRSEIQVFSKDLRLTGESGSAPIASRYGLHDLVQLNATTVACVIKVDKESLRVLDQNGQVRTLLPSNISNKLERRKEAVAADREGSEIHVDDIVKEWMGNQQQGHVMYVHRNFLFVQTKQIENSGIFVTTSQNVQTVAAKGGRINNVGPDLTKMNPAMQRNGGPNGAATAMAPPKPSMGRDKLIGKTVVIARGPHKGLMGIVKDATDAKAKVEIHGKNKQLSVEKDFLRVKDPITGQTVAMGRGRGGPMGGAPPGSYNTSRTPMGSRVPGAARTPAAADWGSRTPAGVGMGGRTPAWGRSDEGGRTSYGDGSRTSYGNDGSRTSYGGATAYGGSAWSASARTPYGAGTRDDYASGSKTPMGVWGNPGSRTPAYTSNSNSGNAYSAPTPGAGYGGAPTPYNAPTPGAYAAPTPGAFDGPTPRPYGEYRTPAASAPTPGAGYAETPGAFAAETPAAWEDDGPRYE